MTISRYLTAQKISLLVLIKLYCESVPPSSATIPILSFVISHTNSRSHFTLRPRSRQDLDPSFPIEAFEDVLQGQSSNMPGRTLLDVFLKKMWEINSFDAMHGLFDKIGSLLVKDQEDQAELPGLEDPDRILLSKTSHLGVFIRRMRVEFTRLPFDDVVKLWSSFIVYRAPTALWNRRIAELASSSGIDWNAGMMGLRPGDELFDIAYGDLAGTKESGEMASVDDIDRLLDFQLDKLQRLGNRVPEEMRDQLRELLGPHGGSLLQSYLLKFLDAWKAGNYTSAFDNLHRYYDYVMNIQQKSHYQYALLHMAILQADFGCFGEAIAAITEAIATARENQDMHCLNFSLSWLNHMSKAFPKQMKGAGYMGMLGSERDGLAFLKSKAKETKMWNLLSANLLDEANLFLATGESIPKALEHMYQASHLNIKERVGTHGSYMLLMSSFYSRVGVTHLSRVYCDLLLSCYDVGCSMDERVRATCRAAFNTMQQGRYDEALNTIESLDESHHRSIKHHQYIFCSMGYIKLKRAIRRTNWAACEALLSSMNTDSAVDPELTFLITEARIDYLISRGQYEDAFAMIEKHAVSLRDESADIMQRVAMLILKATLFAKLGCPERGFSVALRAASVAFKSRLMPCLWTAVGLLGNILNSVGEYKAAMGLLHAVIPQSLEYADHMLTGTLYSYITDSFIGIAGLDHASGNTRARATNISRAELYIDRARECFKKAEDIEGECEQLMKKSIIAKLRGDEKLAEEWAQNHNKVWDEGRARIADV